VKDLYNEICKMLVKETEKSTHTNGEASPVHGVEESILLKCT
jgi:hypothetical protein